MSRFAPPPSCAATLFVARDHDDDLRARLEQLSTLLVSLAAKHAALGGSLVSRCHVKTAEKCKRLIITRAAYSAGAPFSAAFDVDTFRRRAYGSPEGKMAVGVQGKERTGALGGSGGPAQEYGDM